MNKTLEVKCSLCGGACNFDSRGEWRLIGGLTAWLGLFLLPLGTMTLLDWLIYWDQSIGILIGFVLWAVLTSFFFSHHARWVCSQCGACFPAIRPKWEAEDKTRGQQDLGGDSENRAEDGTVPGAPQG
jgi:hypothetical protein